MSAYKWESLSEADAQLLRSRELDPAGMVVKRVGQDYLVFLHMKSRKETLVRLDGRGGAG